MHLRYARGPVWAAPSFCALAGAAICLATIPQARASDVPESTQNVEKLETVKIQASRIVTRTQAIEAKEKALNIIEVQPLSEMQKPPDANLAEVLRTRWLAPRRRVDDQLPDARREEREDALAHAGTHQRHGAGEQEDPEGDQDGRHAAPHRQPMGRGGRDGHRQRAGGIRQVPDLGPGPGPFGQPAAIQWPDGATSASRPGTASGPAGPAH